MAIESKPGRSVRLRLINTRWPHTPPTVDSGAGSTRRRRAEHRLRLIHPVVTPESLRYHRQDDWSSVVYHCPSVLLFCPCSLDVPACYSTLFLDPR